MKKKFTLKTKIKIFHEKLAIESTTMKILPNTLFVRQLRMLSNGSTDTLAHVAHILSCEEHMIFNFKQLVLYFLLQ